MKTTEPFRHTIAQLAANLYEIHYIGFMGEGDKAHLAETARLLDKADGRLGLYYEVPEMTGFDRAQITAHGELFLKHRPKLKGISVVGAGATVRFGSITVGLLARIPLKHFPSRGEAIGWLKSLAK